MRDVHEQAARLDAANEPFGIATVVRTQGSTPQVIGAKLIVTPDKGRRPLGTLGGGCVEADAIQAAREAIVTGVSSLRAYELNEQLAWNTGLVCGGTMWILAEPGAASLRLEGASVAEDIAAASRGGSPVAWVTRFRREARGLAVESRMLVDVNGGRRGSIGTPDEDSCAATEAVVQMRHAVPRLMPLGDQHDVLIEPITARPQLVVAGGGHVARAIARQAGLLDFDVTVLEDRPEFADPARFDGAKVINEDVPTAISSFEYAWQSYLVIATRGHKLDADCVLAAVKTRVPYIGLLGSRRKTVLIADMLREEGVDQSRIGVIHAPVGLDLGGHAPAEIALSVLAEITKARYQGTGVELRHRSRSRGDADRAETSA
jgi:xanthine dehydrogenase accessory factor